jgi:hypothetical protein
MEEKEGTICIFKTHPRSNRAAPHPVYAQKIRQQSSYRTPHPCIILGGELLLMSKGDFWFCIQYAAKIS